MSNEPESTLEQRLVAQVGLAPDVAAHLHASVARHAGLTMICGPFGNGKTTLSEILASEANVDFRGYLRLPDEICAVLVASRTASVVAVVGSGESDGLFKRWDSMEIDPEMQRAASVTVVTLRLLRPATGSKWPRNGPRPLIAEIILPDGSIPLGTLVDQVRTLVHQGIIDRNEAVRVCEYTE